MRSTLVLLALAAAAPSALAQYPLHTLFGTAAGQGFGEEVIGLGDVNGDGHADFAIDAPSVVFPQTGQAVAAVYSGANGSKLYDIPAVGFYWTLATLDDIDGDGVLDFAGTTGANVIYAHSGKTGAVIFTIPLFVHSNVGSEIQLIGDVNMDGVRDVAVTTDFPFAPPLIIVCNGKTGSIIKSLSPATTHNFRLGDPGDVDLDGKPDVAFSYAGIVEIRRAVDLSPIRMIIGPAGSDFGAAMVNVGDVNGDGHPDLAISAPDFSTPTQTAIGRVTIHSGTNGAVLQTVLGANAGDRLGAALAATDDWNLDGVAELIIGAPGANGGAGEVIVQSLDGPTFARFPGTTPNGRLGWSVANAFDVNGDGFSDVIAGAPFADVGANTTAGRVEVFSAFGIPAGSSTFGAGCPGASGVTPRILTSGGAPTASTGNLDFAIHVAKARPLAPALLVIGLSNTVWSGVPLPIALGPIGIPGCSLYVSADVLPGTLTDEDGQGYAPLFLGQNPGLVGVSVFYQWYVVDPGPGFTPGAMTEALQLVLQ